MSEISIEEVIEEDFGIYPSQQTIKKINELLEKNKDNQEVYNHIIAEISLINDIITYGDQISNIWKHRISLKKDFLSPLKEKNKEWKIENLEYYKKRYNNSKSPFIKSRYAFVILTLTSGQDRFEFSRKCFDSWMEGIKFIYQKVIEDKKDYSDSFELLGIYTNLGIRLILSLNLKEKVEEMTKFIDHILINEEHALLKLVFLEEIIDLLDDLERQGNNLGNIKNNIEKFCKKEIESSFKLNLFPTAERYSNLLSKIKPGYDLESIPAKAYEKDAEIRKDPLIRSHLLECSIKEYQRLQSKYPDKKEELSEKIEELKIDILEENKKIEYKSFGHEIEIKKEEVGNRIKYYKSLGDLFETFIKSNDFVPSIQQTKEQVDEIKKNNPLSFIISHSTNSRFGPIATYSSEEDILKLKYRNHFLLGIKISAVFLNLVWQEIEEELKEEFYKKMINLFQQEEISDIKEFLVKSMNHFQNKDYISSIHLLIPYLEEIVRTIIRKAGASDNVLKTENQKFFRKIEFRSLIGNKEVKKIIDKNLLESLNIFLLVDDQSNLRNLLCHGIISKEECNRYNNIYLIYLTLKLLYLLKSIDNENRKSPEVKK